jgi:hypothetical protein
MVAATHLKVLRVLEQAEALTQRYHVGIANPPYLGSASFNASLKQFAEAHFTEGRTDLFALFISRLTQLCFPGGYVSMVAMQSWLFLSSYEDLRREALTKWCFTSLIHLGPRAFDSLSGEVVQTAAFVLRTKRSTDGHGAFFRLLGGRNEAEKDAALREAISDETSPLRFRASADELLQIPGCPVAYWIGSGVLEAFSHGRELEEIAPVRQGFQTGDNDRFMRQWPEVSFGNCKLDARAKEEVFAALKKWVPYNKGGSFRRWYGNNEYLVAFDEENYAILARSGNCLPSRNLYFKKAITWSALASGAFGARLSPEGFTFSAKGACAFPSANYFELALGLLNSAVAGKVFEFFAATLDFNVGSIRKVPLLPDSAYNSGGISRSVDELIAIARADWDNFETSWDFRDQPLLRSGLKGTTLEASWQNLETQSTAAIRRMQELETENNRLFIAAYGLEGELQPEVPEAQITLARAEARRDMAAFLSYAVGCMMGRYSLEVPGLVLADAGGTLDAYWQKVGQASCLPSSQSEAGIWPALGKETGGTPAPLSALAKETGGTPAPLFYPDADGIIPMLDGEWFEDDVVARAKEFLRATFGEATLNENLRFIEESLGKELRTYFLNDFYKDHLQTYKNRPIYWQLSSGKQKAFQCLVYLHRYTPGTLARIRTEYAIPLQGKLSGRITRLEEGVANASSSVARKKLQTELDLCKKQIVELLAFDEQLRSHADQRITLDLDDGVKNNYAKFGSLVAESKKVCGTKED